MDTALTKLNKTELLTVDNPHYEKIKAKYAHLARVDLADDDKKDQLPIHVILSVGDYARIKTDKAPLVREGEPVAEYTKLGWFIMSPGSEIDQQTMLLTQTSHADYEELCRLDVLGLRDSTEHGFIPSLRNSYNALPKVGTKRVYPGKATTPTFHQTKAEACVG